LVVILNFVFGGCGFAYGGHVEVVISEYIKSFFQGMHFEPF
jgi:hypothetical protein